MTVWMLLVVLTVMLEGETYTFTLRETFPNLETCAFKVAELLKHNPYIVSAHCVEEDKL